MTDNEFETLIAELAPVHTRYNIFVGTKSVTYYETEEEAEQEVARLKALGYDNIRIRTTNW